MTRILIAHSDPWSFAVAVERHLMRSHPDAVVDVVNMIELCGANAVIRPVDRLAARVARVFARFVAPLATGRDLTTEFRPHLASLPIPPLPPSPAELRSYRQGEARIGLGVLSSVTSITTVKDPVSFAEYGPALDAIWAVAHRSAEVGRLVAPMGYDKVFIFNGRHAIARPFCDLVSANTPTIRYEQGGTGNRFIASPGGVHDPDVVAGLIEAHDFDRDAGVAFFEDRLARAPGNAVAFFTAHQQQGRLPANLEDGAVVTLFTSSSDEMLAVSDTGEYGAFPTQFDAALAMVEETRALGLVPVIRFHPHLAYKHHSWTREWDFGALEAAGATLLMPDDPTDSYALVRASRCVMACGSTVAVEATYLGRPSALIGHWAQGVTGAAREILDREAMRAFIAEPTVADGAFDKAIQFGSYCAQAGDLLPGLDNGEHPYFARVDGRIVDPVRYLYQKVRERFSPRSRVILPPGGKVIVDPGVVSKLADDLAGRRSDPSKVSY